MRPDYGITSAPLPQYETPGSDATGCVSKFNGKKYDIGCPEGGTSCCQADTNDNGIAEWIPKGAAQTPAQTFSEAAPAGQTSQTEAPIRPTSSSGGSEQPATTLPTSEAMFANAGKGLALTPAEIEALKNIGALLAIVAIGWLGFQRFSHRR